jgi:hypothetical protein
MGIHWNVCIIYSLCLESERDELLLDSIVFSSGETHVHISTANTMTPNLFLTHISM